MRPRPTALVAAVLATTACAPILPPPVPSAPLPELAVESPSPQPAWSPFDPGADADLNRLRTSGLLVPVRGASLGAIEDSFDAPRDGGRRHDAVDILAPHGAAVVAATDGVVLRAGSNVLGGNVVWMTTDDGRFALYYAHLDRHARGVRPGRRLERGTLLGYVGTTGNAPANVPHLHFQVMRVTDALRWWTGTPVNPVPFLVEGTVVAGAPATP